MEDFVTAPTRAREQFQHWETAVRAGFWTEDKHLQDLVSHYQRPHLASTFATIGALASSLDPLVRENNRDEHLPRLRRFTGTGERVEAVDFHPAYHDLGRAIYGTGLMSWYTEPGRELDTLGALYLFAHNGEGGHCCPLACTAGLIKILQRAGGHDTWLQRLTDPNYDTHFHGAQFLTEVQGGSDVGANAVQAHQSSEGQWTLHGEKWFCSVIDAQLFLVTARSQDASGTRGLTAFAVPRTLADGTTNQFAIRRLKYKLGTRSMASAEVDFVGAHAVPVGDFRTTVEVVLNTSRLYNAVVGAGMIQRCVLEATHYARTRMAFGQPIARYPTVARILARLQTEAYVARSVSFYLAHLSDSLTRNTASEAELATYRMLVNLNKFWVSVATTQCAQDAIEILGGNGAIESFSVLPRLLRDSIVCEAWEGGHNVLCAQVLKDCQKLRLHEVTHGVLRTLAADNGPVQDALTHAFERFARVVQLPMVEASVHIRDVCEGLRTAVAAAILASEQATSSDPKHPVVLEHLLATGAPSYDPLDDATLVQRVRSLCQ